MADDLALLDEFERLIGHPMRTIVWGVSLGSMVTLGLAEQHPHRVSGALPMCGVVADAVPFWNQNFDAAFAFKILFAASEPLIQITGGTPSSAASDRARALLQAAKGTAAGRARTALVAAIREIPTSGFLTTGANQVPPPSGVNLADARASLLADFLADALGSYLQNHPALEQRAGGNPSSNVGVDYGRLVAASPDYAEVSALYAAGGLRLDHDISRLNAAPRTRSDAGAVTYLGRFVTFSGDLRVPAITPQTLADESTPPQLQLEYREKVRAAGRTESLRQLFVDRSLHCNFTTAEILVALETLLMRIATGRWAADDLGALNARSASFDPRHRVPGRIQIVGGPSPHSYPTFVVFQSIGLLRRASGQL